MCAVPNQDSRSRIGAPFLRPILGRRRRLKASSHDRMPQKLGRLPIQGRDSLILQNF
jgi:hypothetical protein